MTSANILCGRLCSSTSQDPHTNVLIWDTGASFGLTPFKSDFISYVKCNTPVKDFTYDNTVIGIGTTIHKFVDENGKYLSLPCISYNLSTMDVRLLSPRTYHHLHGEHSIIKGFDVKMIVRNHNIVITINRQ